MIKRRTEIARRERFDFLRWALREAESSLPDCTLLFVGLDRFAPVFRALDAAPDEWIDKLVIAIKQEIDKRGYTTFEDLPHTVRLDLAVRSCIVAPTEIAMKQAGALLAVSQQPDVFDERDRLFVSSFAKTIEKTLTRDEVRQFLPAVVRAKNQWEGLVDNLDHLVCLLDESGRVERVNRMIETWQLGTVDAATGKSIHQLFHSNCGDFDCEFLANIDTAWTECLSSGESVWETPILDGHTGPCRFTLQRTSQSHHSRSVGLESFAILTVRQIRERADAEDNAPNSAAVANVLEAKEQERRRIALELHDGIGQSLAVVKFSLESLRHSMPDAFGPQTTEQIQKIVRQLRESMDDVQRLSSDLHPRYLESRSLSDALRLLIKELRHTYKDIELQCDIVDSLPGPEGPLKLAAFRVAQEALSNALKHSQATTITLRLHYSTDATRLSILDNGIGFDVLDVWEQMSGQGLAGMEERVNQSNGSLIIVASRAKGTVISATWPK